jgi:DNA-binding transcriptional LysR family regulator
VVQVLRDGSASRFALDWDRLRIFHAAAEAGSFTHAGESLDMSQSAVSRQVSALERELRVPLFHRHARGLVLTEQGELLFRAAQDVFTKLQKAATLLADANAKPSGDLRVTTAVGLGSAWLTPRLSEFIDLYPDIRLQFILTDDQLDLPMREADVAIWFSEPSQNDLIRRPLFTVHYHAYVSAEYVKKHGEPKRIEDLDHHRMLFFGAGQSSLFRDINYLETAGRDGMGPRAAALRINNVYGLKLAAQHGVGVALLPDYMADAGSGLVRVLKEVELPELQTYFVYPEELKNSKRVHVFRDFLVAKARQWKS